MSAQFSWTPAPCGTTLTKEDGSVMQLHTSRVASLWVMGEPSLSQWRRAARLLGLDKRQARRFIRRHRPHHMAAR